MGYKEPKWLAPKSCIPNILTSKFFDINILQALFANPAPIKAFRGHEGGGIPPIPAIIPKPGTLAPQFISARNPQPAYSTP
jgi:hypothetical protein